VRFKLAFAAYNAGTGRTEADLKAPSSSPPYSRFAQGGETHHLSLITRHCGPFHPSQPASFRSFCFFCSLRS